MNKEKVIKAAHDRITISKGKGKEYAPSVQEIQNIIDTEILRTDKETGEMNFVSIDKATEKLVNIYNGNISELLKSGNLLQNDFAFYQFHKNNKNSFL